MIETDLFQFDKEAKELRKRQKLQSRKDILAEIENKQKEILIQDSFKISEYFGISGVYYLFCNEELVYIGESNCIFTRLSQHIQEGIKKFDSFKFEKIDRVNERKRREKYLIRKYRPLLNFKYNLERM